MGKKRLIRNIAGWLLAAVILYILFDTIYGHKEELRSWQWRINWTYLLLSILFLGGAYIAASQSWRTIIAGFGHKIKLYEAFRVVYLAQLGRYIPGKVWQVVGMVGLAKELNIPAGISLASFALVQAYALPAAFLLIFALLGNTGWIDSLMIVRDILYIFMAVALLCFLVLFIRPSGLEWALNKILRLLKRETVSYRPNLGNRLNILILYLITWTLFGFSFFFFLKALVEEPSPYIWQSAGIYIAAYNIGYIFFFSPGGLGVREGVMSALMAPLYTEPVAASIAIINRIWVTLVEGLISLLALLTYKIKPTKD